MLHPIPADVAERGAGDRPSWDPNATLSYLVVLAYVPFSCSWVFSTWVACLVLCSRQAVLARPFESLPVHLMLIRSFNPPVYRPDEVSVLTGHAGIPKAIAGH